MQVGIEVLNLSPRFPTWISFQFVWRQKEFFLIVNVSSCSIFKLVNVPRFFSAMMCNCKGGLKVLMLFVLFGIKIFLVHLAKCLFKMSFVDS